MVAPSQLRDSAGLVAKINESPVFIVNHREMIALLLASAFDNGFLNNKNHQNTNSGGQLTSHNVISAPADKPEPAVVISGCAGCSIATP